MLQIFRVLLPSWKFFDGTLDAPELFYRVSGPDGALAEWILCIPKVGPRSFKQFWINADENFLFASHALLEFLKNDLDEDQEASASLGTSLDLVENLVRFQMRSAKVSAKQFQFRLGFSSQDQDALYTSPTLEVNA